MCFGPQEDVFAQLASRGHCEVFCLLEGTLLYFGASEDTLAHVLATKSAL